MGFFFQFWSSKPWMIRIRVNLKCRPRTDHACPQKQNPSRETVPLNGSYI
jgi:hypothetical protein